MTIAEQIRQEVWKEAEAKHTEKMVLKMIDEGLDVATIVRCTELTTNEVEKLRQKRRRS